MIINKQSAFTIIELMTVVAIVAIMAAIAVPSLNNMVQENKLAGFANDFVASVNIARSEAITNRQSVQISANAGNWSNGWKVVADTNGNGVFTDAEDEEVRSLSLSKGLSLIGTPDAMTINSNGAVNGLNWSGITICDTRSKGRTVNVSGAGITSINKSPTCS